MNPIAKPICRACAAIACLSSIIYAADGNFALWPKDARGALTITWDDNESTQFTKAEPLMTAYGIRGTFFVVTDWIGNGDIVRAVAANGHEIGSHSQSHAYYNTLDSSAIDIDLRRSKEIIDSLVPSQRCITHAYPYCQYEIAHIFAPQYYIAARGCGPPMGPDTGINTIASTPHDLYNVLALWVDRQGTEATSLMLNRHVDTLIARGGWLVELHHGLDSIGFSWIYADTFESHLAYIATKKDSLYVAPFGTVSCYIRERDCATLSLISRTDSQLTYALTDTLSNDSVFSVPLSIKIALPDGWPFGIAVQGPDTMSLSLKNDSLIFDAVPDRGNIIINKSLTAIRHLPRSARLPAFAFTLHPRFLDINAEWEKPYAVSVYSINGKPVKCSARRVYGKLSRHTFDVPLSPGTYIVKISAESKSWAGIISLAGAANQH